MYYSLFLLPPFERFLDDYNVAVTCMSAFDFVGNSHCFVRCDFCRSAAPPEFWTNQHIKETEIEQAKYDSETEDDVTERKQFARSVFQRQ